MTSNNLKNDEDLYWTIVEIDRDKVEELRYAFKALEFSLDDVIHQTKIRILKRLSII